MDPNTELNRIRHCFSKSFTTYDSNAMAQHLISHNLVSLLLQQGYRSCDNLLEIGCGTGALTRELSQRLSVANWTINDLCDESAIYIDQILGHGRYTFLPGDAGQLATDDTFDMIASSSVFQWIDDQAAFFRRLSERLRPDGILAFSSFNTRNMYEVKDLTGKGLDYHSQEQMTAFLQPYFDIQCITSEEITLWFKTPIDILRHLKLTGVTATGDGSWTKGMQQNFVNNYKIKYANSNGECPLTYNPLYVVAKKKS